MTRIRNVIVRLFAHQYAWLLYRHKRVEYLSDSHSEFLTYHVAIIPGLILVFLILAPYAVFIGQYPAPMILNVLTIVALILPTLITLRIYENELAVIKKSGKKILDAAEGLPLPSLAITLSPVGLLFAILLILWFAASSPS